VSRITIKDIRNVFIPKHQSLPFWEEDIIFLWGGRLGGKSESVARHLIIKALKNKNFKGVLARKVFANVKDSSYATIKEYIEKKNIPENVVKFLKTPLEIHLFNKSSFICRGFDKAEKIKGIKEPSDFWIEEAAEISEMDFETALTTLRNSYLKPQMYLTFNPEVRGDLEDSWLYNRFFKDRTNFDFTDTFSVEIDGAKTTFTIRSVHTTYKDNPFCKPEQVAIVENYKNLYEKTKSQRYKYLYEVWTLGHFGQSLTDMPYLSSFSGLLHVKKVLYNSDYPIHISFDKNINPYLPASVFQYINNQYIQIYELALPHPNNRTKKIVQELVKYCKTIQYTSKIYIYGDSTANAEDTNQEVGINFFKIIVSEFKKYGFVTESRVPGFRTNKHLNRKNSNPNSQNAGDYLNYLFDNNRIVINESCKKSITDYVNAPQDRNGRIDKKIKDEATGGDKFGHFTDILKYYICEYDYDQFMKFSENQAFYVM
jgi:phage terminase large subunit